MKLAGSERNFNIGDVVPVITAYIETLPLYNINIENVR